MAKRDCSGTTWMETRKTCRRLHVPAEKVVDTSGAGDVFHGAYCASFLEDPTAPWREHFEFANAAASHKVQHLGNEAGLPSRSDIALARRRLVSAS